MPTAAEYGLADQVVARIEQNPKSVQASDAAGYTPLHFACQHGHVDVVKILIQEGADVNACECGVTPLHRACFAGKLQVVEILIDNGANCFIADSTGVGSGDLPIHKAARQGKLQVIRMLLKR